ncbi:PulJ/GspJ family protein [Desulfolutivibrio sp.]|uniref:PulJ/GspJ family protein n=1 Tax=Desulfolutivibrio sp. TaxID=2773296 RepID=UPI002F96AC77
MTPPIRSQRGFTLIEIIVSLVLLGLLGATVFGFMGQAVRGFFIARDALEITQKAQIALNRMRIELTYLKSVSASSDTSLSFVSIITGVDTTYAIAYDASTDSITWNGVTLTDDVGGLTFAYYDEPGGTASSSFQSTTKLIGITLVMQDSDGATVTFATSVFPGKISL